FGAAGCAQRAVARRAPVGRARRERECGYPVRPLPGCRRMKPLRPQLRGLISKLTLFYLLLSLPCLIVVESAILIFEYATFSRSVDGGSLLRATSRAAGELAAVWPALPADEPAALNSWTQALILRLQRPHG